jgi:Asp-tRNA(Asn)/Glu-tRNA(Gln) amidotransferase A subunit family amidase
MAYEMARALSAERVQHGPALSPRLQALFDEGRTLTGEQHAGHRRQLEASRHRADAWFESFDVLLCPSTTGEAPAGTDATGDPLFCRGWTLLGLPCVHLPFARGRKGLPLGLQLVGRRGEDHRLLAAAQWCMDRLSA